MGRVLTAIKQLVLAGDLDLQVLCDQIVSVLLGYKMTGELKGENHNKAGVSGNSRSRPFPRRKASDAFS